MSAPWDDARYRAIEAINGTATVEHLVTLEEHEDGRLIGQTTDGREVVYTTGYPVKIKEVRTEA